MVVVGLKGVIGEEKARPQAEMGWELACISSTVIEHY